jgi:hypothetical protein
MFSRCVLVLILAASLAGEPMPSAQQSALVKKYRTVCHTDAVKNGGLTLERFDAAHAAPSLTAIMLSKLTSGVTIETAQRAASNAEAAAFVSQKRKAGAMNAAGIPQPDNATIDALIHAFAMRSRSATEWNVERPKASELTASTLREVPSAKNANEAEVYRLIATCNATTRQGELQLTWSPVPQSGSLNASVDRKAPVKFQVRGSEKMGNGNGHILHGLAAVHLQGLPIPADSLTITDLFPGETVVFSFATLPGDARHDLNVCFPVTKSGT